MFRQHVEEGIVMNVQLKPLIAHLDHPKQRLSQYAHRDRLVKRKYLCEILENIVPDLFILDVLYQSECKELVEHRGLRVST